MSSLITSGETGEVSGIPAGTGDAIPAPDITAKDAPREYFTTQGLVAIGEVSNFKIYVLTSTGNERGSNTVKITRTT